jgi:hypothetical protein
MVTLVRVLLPSKAESPMLVTLFPMVMLVTKPLEPVQKALSGMLVKVLPERLRLTYLSERLPFI